LNVISQSTFSNNAICGEVVLEKLKSGIRNYDMKEIVEEGVCKAIQLRSFEVGYSPTLLNNDSV
jgi:hypothetical protein